MSAGPNHGGRKLTCSIVVPSCHLASLDAEVFYPWGVKAQIEHRD